MGGKDWLALVLSLGMFAGALWVSHAHGAAQVARRANPMPVSLPPLELPGPPVEKVVETPRPHRPERRPVAPPPPDRPDDSGRNAPPKFAGAADAQDYEAMREAVMQLRPRVMDCYEPLRRAHPEASARVTAEFNVVPDGPNREGARIESAELVQSTLGNLAVEQCMMNALASVQFPAPSSERVRVRFPFFFGPTAPR